MSDKMLDILTLVLVGWLVYDRMQQKRGAPAVTSAALASTPIMTTEQQVAAILQAE